MGMIGIPRIIPCCHLMTLLLPIFVVTFCFVMSATNVANAFMVSSVTLIGKCGRVVTRESHRDGSKLCRVSADMETDVRLPRKPEKKKSRGFPADITTHFTFNATILCLQRQKNRIRQKLLSVLILTTI